MEEFKNNPLGLSVFKHKYALNPYQTWAEKAKDIVDDVTGYGSQGQYNWPLLNQEERDFLVHAVTNMWFLPAGRYIYYAGRKANFYNNCFAGKAREDTREEWAHLAHWATECLMTGGGLGIDYSIFRPEGAYLARTGGLASGPIPLMKMINEIGRNVMQGGSRRSALYASLNWQHTDIPKFLTSKNWNELQMGKAVNQYGQPYSYHDLKMDDFNGNAPLDMTNISVNYDDDWLNNPVRWCDSIFLKNVEQAMHNGEPGFSFNFGRQSKETARNAPVSAATKVLTKEGYKPVSNLVGKFTEVWTGKQWAHTMFKKTKENVETIRVNLSNGRYIDCDPEHPFITWSNVGTERIQAQHLREGQAIVCELPQDALPKSWFRPEVDYAYGFVFGDGHVRGTKGEISYWVPEKEECFLKSVAALNASRVSIPHRAYFTINPEEYAQVIKNMPPAFIAGWFDADACVSRGMLRLSSNQPDKLLLLSERFDALGIKSTVRRDGGSGFKANQKQYTLQVVKSSFERFMELIPVIRTKVETPTKSVRQQNILVKSVERTGIVEDVFCCDVGVEEHSFMAEGVIISNCAEFITEDHGDVCNLGSLNLGAIPDLDTYKAVVDLASKFLVCGTIRGTVPTEVSANVREKNRRIGLGLMGVHEWMLKKNLPYGMSQELRVWLSIYERHSRASADEICDRLNINTPVACRAIAPAGTISIIAGTSSGIEPLFATAYKRRYLVGNSVWKYQYKIDAITQMLVDQYGFNPDNVETASSLAANPEQRIKFQADVQDYVDMGISSTLNLPAWGTELNNPDKITKMAAIVSEYAPRLRGLTFYPDGSRGGQPLEPVPYAEAIKAGDAEFEENSACRDGVCGI